MSICLLNMIEIENTGNCQIHFNKFKYKTVMKNQKLKISFEDLRGLYFRFEEFFK